MELKIPEWIKTTAGFWSKNQIDDETFVNSLKFLIKENIIQIPEMPKFEPQPLVHFVDPEKSPYHYIERYYNEDYYREWFDENYPEYTIEEAMGIPIDSAIPPWVKTNANSWSNDLITDNDFVNGIEFLIKQGIIVIN